MTTSPSPKRKCQRIITTPIALGLHHRDLPPFPSLPSVPSRPKLTTTFHKTHNATRPRAAHHGDLNPLNMPPSQTTTAPDPLAVDALLPFPPYVKPLP